ncbi:MAG: YggS family pyridoxal phosphate-dependent enzyme [Alphaproteobacteria bacterium]
MTTILARYRAVLDAIAAAELKAGRPAGSVTLVAVSKTFGAEAIRPLLEAGHRVFGENRVQEALAKWPALKRDYPGTELHLVGPLQSNKAKEAARLFDVIETLDREKLARVLAALPPPRPRLLIEVNTGAEPQKAGILPEETASLLATAKGLGLAVEGLMGIPPLTEDPSPHFARLAGLGRAFALPKLSMGMSGDFAAAIAAGATHVRVGAAIFGERH